MNKCEWCAMEVNGDICLDCVLAKGRKTDLEFNDYIVRLMTEQLRPFLAGITEKKLDNLLKISRHKL